MTWVESDRVVTARTSHPVVDVLIGVIAGFQRHQTPRNAAVLTYFGFLSIFPLFMVASSVLGFLLRGNEQLRDDILDTAVAQIPVIGTQVAGETGTLEGSVWGVVVGLSITLWAATRAFAGLQNAFDDVWEVPVTERDNIAVRRVKGIVGILTIGSGLIVTTVLASLVSALDLPVGGRVLLVLGTIAVNGGVLWVMMRYLTAEKVGLGQAWPGAVFGGIGFTSLQVLGSLLVQRFLAGASDTAGTFASVFALMAWINLHAMVSLIAAELNAAIRRRRRKILHATLWLNAEHDLPDDAELENPALPEPSGIDRADRDQTG
ncbi:inner membrane protein YhjD [soil metagenome]